MKIQKISNVSYQNFGNVVVLECGEKVSQLDLDNMVINSPYVKRWTVVSGREKLLVCNGVEQIELDRLDKAVSLVTEESKGSILSRIRTRVQELAQNIKPIIVNSVEDLKRIHDFEALLSVDPIDGFLKSLSSL